MLGIDKDAAELFLKELAAVGAIGIGRHGNDAEDVLTVYEHVVDESLGCERCSRCGDCVCHEDHALCRGCARHAGRRREAEENLARWQGSWTAAAPTRTVPPAVFSTDGTALPCPRRKRCARPWGYSTTIARSRPPVPARGRTRHDPGSANAAPVHRGRTPTPHSAPPELPVVRSRSPVTGGRSSRARRGWRSRQGERRCSRFRRRVRGRGGPVRRRVVGDDRRLPAYPGFRLHQGEFEEFGRSDRPLSRRKGDGKATCRPDCDGAGSRYQPTPRESLRCA